MSIQCKDMNKLDKIKSEFERIKRLGFIKSTRQNNKDGGIGNTFEDYLGVDENNLSDPDFEGFEVKTKRFMNKAGSSYNILIFSHKGIDKRGFTNIWSSNNCKFWTFILI